MALMTQCPEHKEVVVGKDLTCIHCGHPITKEDVHYCLDQDGEPVHVEHFGEISALMPVCGYEVRDDREADHGRQLPKIETIRSCKL